MANQVTVARYKHPRYRWRVFYPDGEKRKYKSLLKKSGKDGAEEWAIAKEQELFEQGAKQAPISDAELRAVYAFREYVESNDRMNEVTLQDAISTFIETSTKRYKSIRITPNRMTLKKA